MSEGAAAGRAVIIGAGPAGLTAALEMLRRTAIVPVILEASEEIGGISRTIRYKGNRMDIGGHRFFSKSDRVMQWWMDLMPPETAEAADAAGGELAEISYQGKRRRVAVPARLEQEPVLRGAGPLDPEAARAVEAGKDEAAEPEPEEVVEEVVAPVPGDPDLVMLIRPRKSRIYYLRRFFAYPIRLTAETLRNLGPVRTWRVGVSYLISRVRQIEPERSLEDFLINRFGRELYLTFFKSYTEKVWGTPCDKISAEWGAQRIKGLSLTTAVRHFLRQAVRGKRKGSGDVQQKGTDTSLIERFLYPKFGPGQLWEHVAHEIVRLGGEIHMGARVDRIGVDGAGQVSGVETVDAAGARRSFAGEWYLSTMPMQELVRGPGGGRSGGTGACAGGERGVAVPGLYHGGDPGGATERDGAGWGLAEGYVDLYPGAGCAAGAAAGVQQLESAHGGGGGQGVAGAGVLLL